MPDAEFIQFTVSELVGAKYVDLGLQRFRVAPRMNEYIEMKADNKAKLYQVIAVIHPIAPTAAAGVLIIKPLGTKDELYNLLRE